MARTVVNVTASSTLDGRDISADGTKLDGIEANATADQNAAEIKSLVEASSDIALAGNPTTTTQSSGNNSTRIATTAFVADATSGLATDSNLNSKAPIASPTFTGNATFGGDVIVSGSNGSATNSLDLIYNGSSGQANIQADSGGGNTFLTFGTSASGSVAERMRITSAGSVGIGTSPSAPLHVKVTEASTGETDPLIRFERFTSGDNAYLDITVDNANNLIGFQSTGSNDGGFTFGGASTERLRIDSTGGVIFKGSLGSHQTNAGVVEYSSNITSIHSYGASSGTGAMRFLTGGGGGSGTSERVRIDASGKVGIGVNSPAATLDVNGTLKLDGNYPVSSYNVALGDTAFDAVTTGTYNTAIGHEALTALTEGYNNTAVGSNSIRSLTTGTNNVGLGQAALYELTTGDYNIAVGRGSLQNSTTPDSNQAIGHEALNDNTTGQYNTAIGINSLALQTTPNHNVAIGYYTGYNNTTGSVNTLIGNYVGYTGTTCDYGVMIGYQSGYYSTTADYNTFVGAYSGFAGTTSQHNACVGYTAGYNLGTGGYHTLVGSAAGDGVTGTAYGNTIIGYAADTSSSAHYESIVLGYTCLGVGTGYFTFGSGNGNNRVYNQFGANASWTRVSDQRYKKDIQNNTDCGLAFINDLRPVTFKWKAKSEIDNTLPDYDADKTEPWYTSKMYGLIAQEVKQVLDNHNITDFGGWHEDEGSGIQGISQEMFIYPLIKAVQELSAKVTALENGG